MKKRQPTKHIQFAFPKEWPYGIGSDDLMSLNRGCQERRNKQNINSMTSTQINHNEADRDDKYSLLYSASDTTRNISVIPHLIFNFSSLFNEVGHMDAGTREANMGYLMT